MANKPAQKLPYKFLYRFFSVLVVGAAIATLISLGVWQLDRLEWKRGLIAKIETELAAPAQDLDSLSGIEFQQDILFQRVKLSSKDGFLSKSTIEIKPKSYIGLIGSYIYSAYEIDRKIIWVFHGWAPQGAAPHDMLFKAKRIEGVLRHPPRGNPFTPQNRPAQNIWYHPNPAEMSAARGLDPVRTLPLILMRSDTPVAETLVKIPEIRPALRNNHLQYAVFWFTMAGVLLIIYGLVLRSNLGYSGSNKSNASNQSQQVPTNK